MKSATDPRLHPGKNGKLLYKSKTYLLDWNQEPGAVDEGGGPTDTTLPYTDMIVFITEYDNSNIEFRSEIETFRKEDALR